jgi:hypothetical protein
VDTRWLLGLAGVLVAAGITGGVTLYAEVQAEARDNRTMRREIDSLQRKEAVYGEAIARLEERVRCGH